MTNTEIKKAVIKPLNVEKALLKFKKRVERHKCYEGHHWSFCKTCQKNMKLIDLFQRFKKTLDVERAKTRAEISKGTFKEIDDVIRLEIERQERHRILKAIDELSVTISYSDSGIINVVRVDELKTKISEADKR